MWPVNKVETHFGKKAFVHWKWSNLNALWSYNPYSHSFFGGLLWGALLSASSIFLLLHAEKETFYSRPQKWMTARGVIFDFWLLTNTFWEICKVVRVGRKSTAHCRSLSGKKPFRCSVCTMCRCHTYINWLSIHEGANGAAQWWSFGIDADH